ncbi:MAG TPA: GvpL/GvpF family gas vesicle protein [Vicinamibacterales bacterium]|nr:GvpL/GvpF family gas vesicle protein [Vicinamibacterales bacterium]
MTRSTAAYLYCVVRATKKPPLARIPAGLPGATRPAAHKLAASLWLVTADVPLDRYDPSHLEPKLRDLEWVSEIAIAHESVIEHFSRLPGAAVVPTKLFTMFSSIDKALADVGAKRAAIERAMRHIAGSEEWGVRITRRPASAAPAAGAARPTSGAAFLTAKKQARDSIAAHRAATLAAAATAFERLGRYARDANKRPRRQEPGTNPPILEAAFLVPAAGRARFKAEAKRQAALCASAGADMTVTGPWPAYNFIGAEAGA